MATILDKIVATKHEEIARAKSAVTESELKSQLADALPVRDFFTPLAAGPPIRLIAEVKKASPSAGIIREDFDPVGRFFLHDLPGAFSAHGVGFCFTCDVRCQSGGIAFNGEAGRSGCFVIIARLKNDSAEYQQCCQQGSSPED